MSKKNALRKAVLPILLTALLFPLVAINSDGRFLASCCTVTDSTGLGTPTASGTDYNEVEDCDSEFNSGIESRRAEAVKSRKIYTTSGIPVTKAKHGGVYIKNRKKFVFAD